jgi:polar amino acid transport system permease protein
MQELDDYLRLLPLLLQGAGATVSIAAQALIAAIAVAFLVGLARLSSISAVSRAAKIYVEFFRGTSLLVQLFFLYYILPLYGARLSAEVTAILGLGLNLGAYGSEIVRSGIDSVDNGQYEAATSLGLPRWVGFWKIILPQALIVMLPSFGNLAIEIVKATALVSLITISELTFMGHSLINITGDTRSVWTIVLVLYLAINTPLNLAVLWAERRANRFKRGPAGGV